jgi:catechol 2,3-dioxygenase-like lactoylglutathione lyase family enzyme
MTAPFLPMADSIQGVLEACLYASNLDLAEQFYGDLLGLELVAREPGRHLFFRCGEGMFLLFNPACTSTEQTEIAGVRIPLHGAQGAGHVAFRVSEAVLPAWRDRLRQAGVTIESEVTWPSGGHSLYCRDPAGNSIELATLALWGLPSE